MASLASHPMVAFSPVVAFRETRPGAGFCAVARRDGARSPCAVALGAKRRVAPVAAVARASRGDAPRRPKGARARRATRRRDGRPRPLRSVDGGETGAAGVATAEEPSAVDGAADADAARRGASPSDAVAPSGSSASSASSPGTAADAAPSSSSSTREVATTVAFAALAASAVASAGGPAGALVELQRFGRLLVENHLPGVGGVIEDSFLGLLVACTVYSLWRSSLIPAPVGNPIARKSRTPASWLHVVSGGGALATGLYGVVLERVYRESPGWGWMWVSSALFLANALSYSPLMSIFKASKEGKYAMKLGYSFVASFQGVVFIAWSAQPDAPEWMYWAVMPFWYFSVAKLWESTEFVLALAPASESKDGFLDKITAGSKRRLGRMTPDAATLTYVSLNAFAAIFDNAYMALYTALGPEQFWHTSQAFNDADFHLRLVKGTTGSLTVALLIFISTLGWRRQMPMNLAIWLNVILGSVGPWIVLFWHKLVDPSEDWFPQFVFDPAYDYAPLWETARAAIES